MAKKQFRGVIAFDFDVDQENYRMFGALETALEKHMALFAERLAEGKMDGEFELSKHVSVENPQSHFRDRRGPTGPVEMMVFRGGRGDNSKLSKAQIDRFVEMGKRLAQGHEFSESEMKRYASYKLKADKQGIVTGAPEIGSPKMTVGTGTARRGIYTKTIKMPKKLSDIIKRRAIDRAKVGSIKSFNVHTTMKVDTGEFSLLDGLKAKLSGSVTPKEVESLYALLKQARLNTESNPEAVTMDDVQAVAAELGLDGDQISQFRSDAEAVVRQVS